MGESGPQLKRSNLFEFPKANAHEDIRRDLMSQVKDELNKMRRLLKIKKRTLSEVGLENFANGQVRPQYILDSEEKLQNNIELLKASILEGELLLAEKKGASIEKLEKYLYKQPI